MSRHKLKLKKIDKGKQFWAQDFYVVPQGYVPASHHAEDRYFSCGRCGHPWSWHDNVWMRVDDEGKPILASVKIRCRGGYVVGMAVFGCSCREVYPGGGTPDL